MNLTKLFDMQKVLDERIIKEKGLEGQDLLSKRILALQVELGELANEWRRFKFWSEDQEPRTTSKCWNCLGKGKGYFSGRRWTGNKETCITCGGTGINENENPLLEEYIDCLHFILSIGLERKVDINFDWYKSKRENITEQFLTLFCDAADLQFSSSPKLAYLSLVAHFIGLGEMLGFTWEEIEREYYRKNNINHERQGSGY